MNQRVSFHKPFKLGKLTLPSNVMYAPLAGCSDFPFRKMASRYKPGLMYCEMVKMDALVRNDSGTLKMLDYSSDMGLIGGQICGSKPQIAGQSAKMIEDLGFNVVDLNCGCPVDKITKDGSGSGMLKTPQLIGEIIHEMVKAVNIPVTVKVRAGWDDNSINVEEVTKIAEEAGAVAICVHGRTREQGYKGPANWDYVKRAKLASKTIQVIGNGDLFSPEAVEKMFIETNCDAVLISRGTMGHPWIAEDIRRHLDGLEPISRGQEAFRKGLQEHFEEIKAYYPEEKRVVIDMRRVGSWYCKNSYGASSFRGNMGKAQTIQDVQKLIDEFPWQQASSGNQEDSTPCEC